MRGMWEAKIDHVPVVGILGFIQLNFELLCFKPSKKDAAPATGMESRDCSKAVALACAHVKPSWH